MGKLSSSTTALKYFGTNRVLQKVWTCCESNFNSFPEIHSFNIHTMLTKAKKRKIVILISWHSVLLFILYYTVLKLCGNNGTGQKSMFSNGTHLYFWILSKFLARFLDFNYRPICIWWATVYTDALIKPKFNK